jgi:hypothetical protein
LEIKASFLGLIGFFSILLKDLLSKVKDGCMRTNFSLFFFLSKGVADFLLKVVGNEK